MRGISTIMSAVILILIVMAMATFIAPWAIQLARDMAEGAGDEASQDLVCRQSAYDFVSDFGSHGVNHSVNGTTGNITARIRNTGYRNLYNFSFELIYETSSGERILGYPYVNITSYTQKTGSDPLKPGRTMDLNATITGSNENWTLSSVKVLNQVCPSVSPDVDM